jgi:hypothetical protein
LKLEAIDIGLDGKGAPDGSGTLGAKCGGMKGFAVRVGARTHQQLTTLQYSVVGLLFDLELLRDP